MRKKLISLKNVLLTIMVLFTFNSYSASNSDTSTVYFVQFTDSDSLGIVKGIDAYQLVGIEFLNGRDSMLFDISITDSLVYVKNKLGYLTTYRPKVIIYTGKDIGNFRRYEAELIFCKAFVKVDLLKTQIQTVFLPQKYPRRGTALIYFESLLERGVIAIRNKDNEVINEVSFDIGLRQNFYLNFFTVDVSNLPCGYYKFYYANFFFLELFVNKYN